MDAQDLANAYRRFVELRRTVATYGPEIIRLHSYGLCDLLQSECRFHISMIEMQIASDLRELINCQNRWQGELSKWHEWMRVLPEYDGEKQWDLRIEFVNGVARGCMLEPSAMHDRVLRGLHFALHHANLTVVPGYKDELPEDARARKSLHSGQGGRRNGYRARHDLTASVYGLARNWAREGLNNAETAAV